MKRTTKMSVRWTRTLRWVFSAMSAVIAVGCGAAQLQHDGELRAHSCNGAQPNCFNICVPQTVAVPPAATGLCGPAATLNTVLRGNMWTCIGWVGGAISSCQTNWTSACITKMNAANAHNSCKETQMACWSCGLHLS